MTSKKNIHDTVEEFKNSNRSMAEFLASVFKDKIVEIYIGDSYEDISTEQISTSYPAVFCRQSYYSI